MAVKILRIVQYNSVEGLSELLYCENQHVIQRGEVLFMLILAGRENKVVLYSLSKDQRVFIPTKTMELEALAGSCRWMETVREFKDWGSRGSLPIKRKNISHKAVLVCIPNLHTVETMGAYVSCLLETVLTGEFISLSQLSKVTFFDVSSEQQAEENGEYLEAQAYSNRLYDYRQKFEQATKYGKIAAFKVSMSGVSGRPFSEQRLIKGVFCNLAAECIYTGKIFNAEATFNFEKLMLAIDNRCSPLPTN